MEQKKGPEESGHSGMKEWKMTKKEWIEMSNRLFVAFEKYRKKCKDITDQEELKRLGAKASAAHHAILSEYGYRIVPGRLGKTLPSWDENDL